MRRYWYTIRELDNGAFELHFPGLSGIPLVIAPSKRKVRKKGIRTLISWLKEHQRQGLHLPKDPLTVKHFDIDHTDLDRYPSLEHGREHKDEVSELR